MSVVDGVAAVGSGRVDNRESLVGQLVGDDRRPLTEAATDSELLVSAYRRWQDDVPARLLGDWAVAAWHPADRHLFLARDQFGDSPLYYFADARVFAFATSRDALLALGTIPTETDELYLAQILVSWHGGLANRTTRRHIRLLPPAHALTLSADGIEIRRYWRMEDVRELRLRSRADYVEGFRAVLDEAVRVRLPASGPVGIALSGGLDSSAVAATAAKWRQDGPERLVAFTSVPVSDTSAYVGPRFGDELDLATATAEAIGSIPVVALPGTTWTPVGAIRQTLEIHSQPLHAASNLYWLLDLLATARRFGCATLLTGQMGDAGISWTGDPRSQSRRYQLHRLGLRSTFRSWLRHTAPRWLLQARARKRVDPEWYRTSAISPSFAQRLQLLERRLADPDQLPPRGVLERRLRILAPTQPSVGAFWSECGGAFDVDVRDPTADVRVVSFALSIPDRIFIDPDTGLDRWLIRETMKDYLPDQVRLNRRRGRQAGDLVPRLRASGDEVEVALDELGAGAASAYLDVAYMRDVWKLVQSVDCVEAHRKAVTVLMRGIMVGLYVNGPTAG